MEINKHVYKSPLHWKSGATAPDTIMALEEEDKAKNQWTYLEIKGTIRNLSP